MFADFTFFDGLGVLGSLIIAAAYLGVSLARLDATRAPYNLMNLIGAALVLVSLYLRPNAGAIIVEVLWIMIALFALARWARGR
ncbi:MAG: hypothetical protein ACC631_07540 [Halocynthiibacter sp.]